MTTPHIQWSALAPDLILLGGAGFLLLVAVAVRDRLARDVADRKSTRLNSSHG